jgi:hypothetical protein
MRIKLDSRFGTTWVWLRDGVVVGAFGQEPKSYIGLTLDQARKRNRYGC